MILAMMPTSPGRWPVHYGVMQSSEAIVRVDSCCGVKKELVRSSGVNPINL